MSDQTMKILKMLEEGKLSVEEADRLLAKIQELEAAAIAAPPPPPPPPPRRRVPDASKTYAIALGRWPQRGPADAKVTIVFVHDYSCPYCDRARATPIRRGSLDRHVGALSWPAMTGGATGSAGRILEEVRQWTRSHHSRRTCTSTALGPMRTRPWFPSRRSR
jgi:hypothetical protein